LAFFLSSFLSYAAFAASIIAVMATEDVEGRVAVVESLVVVVWKANSRWCGIEWFERKEADGRWCDGLKAMGSPKDEAKISITSKLL
jgi:hypothetical protein